MSKLAHSNDETMRKIESDRMLEDDPTLFRCVNCGLASYDETKPCDCITDCGYRPRKGNGPDVIIWENCREPKVCPSCNRRLP